MTNIAFLGCGKMGRAMIDGILRRGIYSADRIRAHDPSPASQDWLRERGILPAESNAAAAAEAELVCLLCKPTQSREVIEEIRDALPPEAVFVSIPLGLSLARLRELFGRPVKLVRVMPNMPALIGEGMSGYCAGEGLSEENLSKVEAVLGALGLCEQVEERLMAAVTAVSGSAPAYVFLFLEALADAAVREGMPRDMALRFAAQTVQGSAKLLQETGEHPGVLKDMICTPGGSTIEAVALLEKKGFRAAVMEAMEACAKKARD